MIPSVLPWFSPTAFSRYLINTHSLRYVLKSLSARSQLPRRFPIQSTLRSPVMTIRHVRNVTPPSPCGMHFLRRVCASERSDANLAKIFALLGDLGPFFSFLPSNHAAAPMMYEPPLSIFICTALRCTHVRMLITRGCGSRCDGGCEDWT